MNGRRAWRGPALGAVALGLLGRAVAGPLPLNYYDTAYALIWGRQLDHGQLPTYRMPGASTPHPLATAIGAIAALLGTRWSWRAVELVVLLAFGALGVALYVLVRKFCESRVAGAIATAALLASPPFLTNALGGSGLADLPAAAFVVGAAALELRRPRRGEGPLVLLALAGLLRPEAWALSALYWCWLALARPGRAALTRYGALALAAPVVWLGSDLLITGSATYSLSHTQTGVVRELRHSSLTNAPDAGYVGLRTLLGLPVLVVAVAGAGLAALRRRAGAAVPLALLALSAAEFLVLGALRLPLDTRYLLVLAAMLAGFFGYAVTVGRRDLRGLTGWVPLLGSATFVAAAAVVCFVAASDVHGLSGVRGEQHAATAAESDLIALAPTADRLLSRCGPLIVPRVDLVPLAAYDFDLSASAVLRLDAGVPQRGVALLPRRKAVGRYFNVGPRHLRRARSELAGAGFVAVAADRSWRLVAAGCQT